MPPIIDPEACRPCGTCAAICPVDVFEHTGPGVAPIIKYPEECWHCNSCELDCPRGAISLRLPLPAMMLYVDAPNAAKKG